MTSRLVGFVVPAEFVLAHSVPTPTELQRGFVDGWLDAHGVVQAPTCEVRQRYPHFGS
jgi:hypothetical protein